MWKTINGYRIHQHECWTEDSLLVRWSFIRIIKVLSSYSYYIEINNGICSGNFCSSTINGLFWNDAMMYKRFMCCLSEQNYSKIGINFAILRIVNWIGKYSGVVIHFWHWPNPSQWLVSWLHLAKLSLSNLLRKWNIALEYHNIIKGVIESCDNTCSFITRISTKRTPNQIITNWYLLF